jgi:putative FmdB family regulatory protein
MPTYDYRCQACKRTFTLARTWEEFDKQRKPKCPKCRKSGQVQQLLGGVLVKTSKKS